MKHARWAAGQPCFESALAPGREFGVDVDFGPIQTTIKQKQANDARQGRRKET
jgi:hypothetical protein